MMASTQGNRPSAHVTEARAAAQRAKLDTMEERRRAAEEAAAARQAKGAKGKHRQESLLARRRADTCTGYIGYPFAETAFE